MKYWPLHVFIALSSSNSALGELASEHVDCAIRMRKVSEAAQSYRRTHRGSWPESLSVLRTAGLLRAGDDCCPLIARERAGRNPDALYSSRGEGKAAEGTYQYELAHQEFHTAHKFALLRRPFWEQVPILRCYRHRETQQVLNVTAQGTAYLSATFWETLFVDDVPLTYRHPFLVQTRPAPPFTAGLPPRAPELPPSALDLSAWCNAYPADPWWWGKPTLSDRRPAATLAALISDFPTGAAQIGEIWFDLRCVAQTATVLPGTTDPASGFLLQAFPTTRKAFPVARTFDRAYLLIGTVWADQKDREVGNFRWHFADGTQAITRIRYGRDVECFKEPVPALVPHWSGSSASGKVHLWILEWRNPNPNISVTSVDFSADSTSRASPFVAAMTLSP